MLRLVSAILAAVLLSAQTPMLPGFPPGTFQSRAALDATTGGGSFVGLGDLSLSVTIISYHGVRCFKKTSTAFIADITDSATGTTTGTRLKCDGAGNVVAVIGSTCATSTGGFAFVTGGACSTLATTCTIACNVLTLYDQTGNTNCSGSVCDITQAINASRPSFLPNTQNGYGVMRSANSLMGSATGLSTFSQPISVSAVAGKRTDTSGGSMFMGGFSGVIIGYFSGANTGDVNAGANATFTMSDNVYHSLQAVVNGSSSQACVDSSACNTGLVSGSGTLTSNPVQMFNWFSNNAFDEMEGALFSGAFSGGDITAITNNQHSATSGYNF